MFERYTEEARRTIFFAYHAASQHGTPEIGTPSLLLGILFQDKELMARFLPAGAKQIARLSADVEELYPKMVGKTAEGKDLPLSDGAKSVLYRAEREAKRRGHKSIDPRHLLWGLLAEGGPETAYLRSHGITAEAVNAELDQSQRTDRDV